MRTRLAIAPSTFGRVCLGLAAFLFAVALSPERAVKLEIGVDRAEAGFGGGRGGGRAMRGGGGGGRAAIGHRGGGGIKARPGRPPAGAKIRPRPKPGGGAARPNRPNRPVLGARPNRPNAGNRPEAGNRPNRPNAGNRPDRPNAGNRPDRPNAGNRPNRPNAGNRPNRPNAGNRPNRPNAGNRPNRPVGNRPVRPGRPGLRPPGYRPPHYRPPYWRPPGWRPPHYRPPYVRPPHYHWGRYYWSPAWGWYFTAAVVGSTLVFIDSLPDDDGCEEVRYEDETLYECDGVLYRSTLHDDERVYEVVSSEEEAEAALAGDGAAAASPAPVPGSADGAGPLFLTSPMMRGNRVKAAQIALDAFGYDVGTPDGVFGAGTDRAVRAFQRDQGLPETGIVAGETETALGL